MAGGRDLEQRQACTGLFQRIAHLFEQRCREVDAVAEAEAKSIEKRKRRKW
jgi:hypothetical protein